MEGEAEVEHHTPEESETAKDATYGTDVCEEQVIVNIHSTEYFVRTDKGVSVEEGAEVHDI